jgi:hypothetical protein
VGAAERQHALRRELAVGAAQVSTREPRAHLRRDPERGARHAERIEQQRQFERAVLAVGDARNAQRSLHFLHVGVPALVAEARTVREQVAQCDRALRRAGLGHALRVEAGEHADLPDLRQHARGRRVRCGLRRADGWVASRAPARASACAPRVRRAPPSGRAARGLGHAASARSPPKTAAMRHEPGARRIRHPPAPRTSAVRVARGRSTARLQREPKGSRSARMRHVP